MKAKNKGGLPRCPNHGEPLMCEFPLPRKGNARCPISMAVFAYEVETRAHGVVKNKDGEADKSPTWAVDGAD